MHEKLQAALLSAPRPFYESDGIAIYHGDCRRVLPFLQEFDLLLTDPPYGINADANHAHNAGKNGWKCHGETNWDSERPPKSIFHMMIEASRQQIIWGGNYFTDILPPTMRWLVWDKGQRNFSLADVEFAWTSQQKAARVFDYSRAKALQDGKVHPTQKPVALMRWCLDLVREAETVLDVFMGSGTTLLAAKLEGRHAVGIEQQEKYCEIAAKRLEQGLLF